jgi:hypothetical protein
MQGTMTAIIILGYTVPMGALLAFARRRNWRALRRLWIVAAVAAVLIGLVL